MPTEYNIHRGSFSSDKLLSQDIYTHRRINRGNNCLSNITQSTLNHVITCSNTTENLLSNRLTYNQINKIYQKCKTKNNNPISLSKTKKSQSNIPLSTNRNNKKAKSYIKSIYNLTESPRKIINKFKKNYENKKPKTDQISSNYNTFLKNNIKTNNFSNYSNYSNYRVNTTCGVNRPVVNAEKISFRDSLCSGCNLYKKNQELNKTNKIKQNIKLIKNFDHKFDVGKKMNNIEYKSYMDELKVNLEKSRSKSKPKVKFDY